MSQTKQHRQPLLAQSITPRVDAPGYVLIITGLHGRLLVRSFHTGRRDAMHHGMVYREQLAARESAAAQVIGGAL